MERALACLNLVLVVDDFEDAGAELGAHLAQDSVGLKALDYEVFQFVHSFDIINKFEFKYQH